MYRVLFFCSPQRIFQLKQWKLASYYNDTCREDCLYDHPEKNLQPVPRSLQQ